MNSVESGDALERYVFQYVSAELSAGRFMFRPESAFIDRKKAYFSRDRGTSIVFDIAVEACLPGAQSASVIVLIECKNYNHAVPVNDVEEFFAKIQQVAAAKAKGIMFASSSFQKGSLEFARSKGIGLVRVFPHSEFKWELRRTVFLADGASKTETELRIRTGMLSDDYRSRRSAFYGYAGGAFQSSINETAMRLFSKDELVQLLEISATRARSIPIPFLPKESIDEQCEEVLSAAEYKTGPVKLSQISASLGLRLIEANRRTGDESSVLGRIDFEAREIRLYPDTSASRRRFTLAHEIGHFALGHGSYFLNETVDEDDFKYSRDDDRDSESIRRVEWQANYFASHLLLPTKALVEQLYIQARKHDLRDKGHGLIYVDYQPANQATYHAVTAALGSYFQASKSAVSFRLAALGVLNDQRGMQSFRLTD